MRWFPHTNKLKGYKQMIILVSCWYHHAVYFHISGQHTNHRKSAFCCVIESHRLQTLNIKASFELWS